MWRRLSSIDTLSLAIGVSEIEPSINNKLPAIIVGADAIGLS